MIEYALTNLKPGTGKTTSGVYLAYAFWEMGYETWLYDCDPARSALRWSDMIASTDPDGRGFPFHVVGLAIKDAGRRADEFGGSASVRIFDLPQMEDHGVIVRSVLRRVNRALVTTAPNPGEIDRMAPIQDAFDEIDTVRAEPLAASVLLNRVITNSRAGEFWATQLEKAGYHVLRTRVPHRLTYAQAFGKALTARATAYQVLAEELVDLDKLETT